MKILELENQREEISKKLSSNLSVQQKLNLLNSFIDQIFLFGNRNIVESYLNEFIKEYTSLLSKYEVFGIAPSNTEKTIKRIEKIENLGIV